MTPRDRLIVAGLVRPGPPAATPTTWIESPRTLRLDARARAIAKYRMTLGPAADCQNDEIMLILGIIQERHDNERYPRHAE